MDPKEKRIFLNLEEAAIVASIISDIPQVNACCPRHLRLALIILAYAVDRNADELIAIVKTLHEADTSSLPSLEVLKPAPGIH